MTEQVAHPAEEADGLVIDGTGGEPLRPNEPPVLAAQLDHRIAMSFAIAGLATIGGVGIDDVGPVATSYPDFFRTLDALTGRAESAA